MRCQMIYQKVNIAKEYSTTMIPMETKYHLPHWTHSPPHRNSAALLVVMETLPQNFWTLAISKITTGGMLTTNNALLPGKHSTIWLLGRNHNHFSMKV